MARPINMTMLIILKIDVNKLALLTKPQIIKPKAKASMKKKIPDSNAISLLGVCFIVLPYYVFVQFVVNMAIPCLLF